MTEIIHGNTNKNVYKKVRVWGKGQFTIPADIRNRLGIGEDTYLEVFQVGKAIIATPEKIIIKELSNIVRQGNGPKRYCTGTATVRIKGRRA